MAPIKFTESVVTAKSPNLSKTGFCLNINTRYFRRQQCATGGWGSIQRGRLSMKQLKLYFPTVKIGHWSPSLFPFVPIVNNSLRLYD